MVEQARTDRQELGEEVELALAYARQHDRPMMKSVFELDRRLAGVVATSSETMIGQMRLAWWRDLLEKPVSARPSGEPLIRRLGDTWGESAREFCPLVDGWEALLVADALDKETLRKFCEGRAEAWAAIARALELPGTDQRRAYNAGYRWALADLAAHLSDEGERSMALDLAKGLEPAAPLHRRLRPLAILSGLAKRSLAMGGVPLLEGRTAALLALRIGISGR